MRWYGTLSLVPLYNISCKFVWLPPYLGPSLHILKSTWYTHSLDSCKMIYQLNYYNNRILFRGGWLIFPKVRFPFWFPNRWTPIFLNGILVAPGWPTELPSLCCSPWRTAAFCSGWQRFCRRGSRIMGDPGGKMNVELTFAEKKKKTMGELLCLGRRGLHENFAHVISYLMYFICMSCGDSFWNLLGCFQVQICTLLGGVSPSKHQTQSQEPKVKIREGDGQLKNCKRTSNIRQLEFLAPVSSSMMVRLQFALWFTMIHGKNYLNHLYIISTGNSGFKRRLVLKVSQCQCCRLCRLPTVHMSRHRLMQNLRETKAFSRQSFGVDLEELGWLFGQSSQS